MKKLDIQNILVPVDFSELSIQAIATAQRLARRSNATVHLVHVHEYYYPVGFMSPGAAVPMSMVTFRDDAVQRAGQDLRTLAIKNEISPVHCYVTEQLPIFNEICNVAKTIKADLIVMPTHGRKGLKHLAIGSTAERVVQHSPCPVFVVKSQSAKKAEASRGIDTILVPVDFSPCSFEGLNYAIRFADKFAAKILIFNTVYLGYAYTADGFAMYNLSALQDQALKDAEREMAEFVHRALFGSVKFETAVQLGLPVDDICAFAEQKKVDLIITSTHGRTGFSHVMIGSTAEQVVRRATRPILVVPSHPDVRLSQLTGQTGGARKTFRRTTSRTATKEKSLPNERFLNQLRNAKSNPFPERRKTNKFREPHANFAR